MHRRAITRARTHCARRCDGPGLDGDFTPLRGNTPFNNWLVVATKP
jgi:hypothetical protein